MRASAAFEAVTPSAQTGPQGPIRTCIGCRQRGSATELLRVVVTPDAAGEAPGGAVHVVPDPRRRAPGRGAWVHPVLQCVEIAQRRQAFGRALRVSGQLDVSAVREHVEQYPSTTPPSGIPLGDEEQ